MSDQRDIFLKKFTKDGWESLAHAMAASVTTAYHHYYSHHHVVVGAHLVTFPDKSWVEVCYKGTIESEGTGEEL